MSSFRAVLLSLTAIAIVLTTACARAGHGGSAAAAAAPPAQPVVAEDAAIRTAAPAEPMPTGVAGGTGPVGAEIRAPRLARGAMLPAPGAPLLAGLPVEHEAPGKLPGQRLRISHERRTTKYPITRVEEVVVHDARGRQTVLSREEMVGDHALVRLAPGATEDDLRALATQLGAAVRRPHARSQTFLVSVPLRDHTTLPDLIAALRAAGPVRSAETDRIVHALVEPADPRFAEQWALRNVGQDSGLPGADIAATEAWAIATDARSVLVAVIDTGIDRDHPDLQPSIWRNPGESGLDGQGRDRASNGVDDDGNGFIDDVSGWNFVDGTNNPADDNLHGTHVAGTIGAAGGNGIGVTGVAWRASILPVKFLDGGGSGYLSDAVDAIAYAAMLGARVANNSWGGGYSQAIADAVEQARLAGMLCVCAAGNDGDLHDPQADCPSGLSSANVLAVASSNRHDRLSSFSNYSPNTVHLAAPGESILSTLPVVPTPYMASVKMSGSYGTLSGTSMATPHVSGALALLAAAHPELGMLELKARLLERCDRLGSLAGKSASGRRLDLHALLRDDWTPIQALVAADAPQVDDAPGDADGWFAPGELLAVHVRLASLGEATAMATTVRLVIESGQAAVIGPDVLTAGDLPVQAVQDLASAFFIRLPTAVSDLTEITCRIEVQADNAAQMTRTFPVVVTVRPSVAEQEFADVQPAVILADQHRPRLYLLDMAGDRLVVVDTALHRTIGLIPLPGEAGYGSCLAMSPDGSRLLALLRDGNGNRISVVDPVAQTLLYDIATPDNGLTLACDARGRFYTMEQPSGEFGFRKMVQRSLADGSVLARFGERQDGMQYRSARLLRISQDGSRLFAGELDLKITGAPGAIQEFDVSQAGAPVLLRNHSYWQGFLSEFEVDEVRQRIYTMSSSAYGVQLTDMASGSFGRFWQVPTPSHGWPMAITSLAVPPGGRPFFGLTNENLIVRFRPSDGRPIGLLVRGVSYASNLLDEVSGPDGRVWYIFHSPHSGRYGIGVIGDQVPLAVEVFPSAHIAASATRGPAPMSIAFDGSGSADPSEGIAAWDWDFGDGSTASGRIVSHTFSTLGTYRVRLTVRNTAGLSASDLLDVTVVDEAISVSPSSLHFAQLAGGAPIGGELVVTNRGVSPASIVVAKRVPAAGGKLSSQLGYLPSSGSGGLAIVNGEWWTSTSVQHPDTGLPLYRLVRIDQTSGRVISVVDQRSELYDIREIAYDGELVWCVSGQGYRLLAYTADGVLVRQLALPAGRLFTGVAVVADEVFLLDRNGNRLLVIGRGDGVVRRDMALAAGATYERMAAGACSLWLCTASSHGYAEVDPIDGHLVRSLTLGGAASIKGLEVDSIGDLIAAGDVAGLNGIFRITTGNGRSWLSLSPERVTIPAGAQQRIQVTADPGLAAAGGNDASILICRTDRAAAVVTVPVTFAVDDGNHPPAARAMSLLLNEDGRIDLRLAGEDADGDALSYTITTAPQFGVLIGSDAQRTYIPNQNATGTDSLAFTVSDGLATSLPAKVSLTILPIDDLPVAVNQQVQVERNTSLAVTLTASDADGGPTGFALASQPLHGSLSGSPPSLVYVPAAGYVGPDSFLFRVLGGSTAQVAIDVRELSLPTPWRTADIGTTGMAGSAAAALDGTWTVRGAGALGGTADAGRFVYAQLDGNGTVQVRLSSSGVFSAGGGGLAMRTSLSADCPAVSALYNYIDGIAFRTRSVAGGTPTKVLTPAYEPLWLRLTRSGTTVTAYRSADGLTWTQLGTGTLPAGPVQAGMWVSSGYTTSISLSTFTALDLKANQRPVAAAASIATDEEQPVEFLLTGSDPDGDALTWSVVTQPTKGTLSGQPPALRYVPKPDATGADSVVVRASDGRLTSANATIGITIRPVDDHPVARDLQIVCEVDRVATLTLPGFDSDGDVLTYAISTQPAKGALSGSGASRTYTANLGARGADSFAYTVHDGRTTSAPGTVIVRLDQRPVAYGQAVSIGEGEGTFVELRASDPDNLVLTYRLVALPLSGSATLSGSTVLYRPAPGFTGTDRFTFAASDGTLESVPAEVSVTVSAPVPDPWRSVHLDQGSSASFTPGNAGFAVTGTGLPATGDGGGMVVMPAAAPCSLIACLQQIDPGAFAGLALRDGTASESPRLRFGIAGGRLISLTAGDPATASDLGPAAAPMWLRVDAGPDGTATLSTSSDGRIWNQVQSVASGSLSFSGLQAIGGMARFTGVRHFGPEAPADWPQQGAGPRHAGASGAAANGAALNRIWTRNLGCELHPAAVVGSQVLVTPNTYAAGDGFVCALDLADGRVQWQRFLGSSSYVFNSGPSTAEGIAILQREASSNGGVHAVSLATGGLLWSSPYACQSTRHLPPTIFDGQIHANAGMYGGMISLHLANGSPRWSIGSPLLPQVHDWTPAVDAAAAYTYLRGVFRAHDRANGSVLWSLTVDAGDQYAGDPKSCPVLADGTAIMVGRSLFAVDLATRTLRWSATGSFSGTPAVVDGIVHAISGTKVRAFSLATGAALGDFEAAITLKGQPVVTADRVLAGGDAGVRVFQRSDRVLLQSLSDEGQPVVSGRRVLIAGRLGSVACWVWPAAGNHAPVASAASIAGDEDTAMPVLLAAQDPDGDALAFRITAVPQHGILTGTGRNRIYRPYADWHGTDTATFVVNDGSVDSAPATITFVCANINDPPWANPAVVIVAENATAAVQPQAGDADGDVLSWSVASPPAHGSFSITAGGISYTPANRYAGTDQAVLRATDGQGGSALCPVSITILPVHTDQPPLMSDRMVAAVEDIPSAIVLTADDPEGLPLTFRVIAPPAHGVLTGDAPALTYTPDPDWSGTDSFLAEASDGTNWSSPATVTITVQAVNDRPSILVGADQVADNDGRPVTVPGWIAQFTPGPADESGQRASYVVTADRSDLFAVQPAVSADGTLTFTPALDAVGTAIITVVCQDDGGTANGGVDTALPATARIAVLSRWDAELAAEAVAAVALVASDVQAAESGDPGRLIVTRSGPVAGDLAVNLTCTGTAGNGIDIVRIPASVTIPAGQAAVDVVITPLQDGLAEGNESVSIAIAAGAGYRQLPGTLQSATVTLVDDEPVTVNIAASDATMTEPADNGTFTISRTGAPTTALIVQLSAAGTAVPGADYAALPVSVTIPAGATSVAVPAAVIDDAEAEERETVILMVQPGSGYVVGTAQATATIGDNEPEVVGIEPAYGPAAEPGIAGTFRVYRRGVASAARTLTYTVAGTATAGSDYPVLPGSVTLAANTSSVNITVTPSNDSLVEDAESVDITLAAPSGAGLGNATASLTILDNDGTVRPVVSLKAGIAAAREPASDGTFIITRTGATTAPLRVLLQPATGTATAGVDYAALPSQVDIPAGAASLTLAAHPLDDQLAEASETIGLALAASPDYSASTTRSGTVTIADDEQPAVVLAVADGTAAEPGSDTGRWTVTRTGDLVQPLTVLLASSGSAGSGTDHAALPASATIPAGATTATITLTALDDAEAETDEQVVLQLLPDPAYRLGGAIAGTVTIKDDEAAVLDLLATDPTATEGGDTGRFRIQRRGSLAAALTIPLAWSGTAQNGVDVNTMASSVVLGANVAGLDLTVTVRQDSTIEPGETLTGTLQAGAGYALGQAAATVRIADDENGGTVGIRLPTPSGYEFDAVPAFVEIYRTGKVSAAITVPYAIAGTATVRELTLPRQVVLPAGVDQVRLQLTPLRDERVESDETVILDLLPGSGYVLGTGVEGVFTIIESPPGSG